MKQLLTRHGYPVGAVCSVLEVSRSGYYAWRDRPASARAQSDERLAVAIRAAHEAGRHTYGTRRVQAHLREHGLPVGRDRVGRLRRQMGLGCKQKGCFRVTTDSEHTLPVADNLLQQNFAASAPDRVWMTDITYIVGPAKSFVRSDNANAAPQQLSRSRRLSSRAYLRRPTVRGCVPCAQIAAPSLAAAPFEAGTKKLARCPAWRSRAAASAGCSPPRS